MHSKIWGPYGWHYIHLVTYSMPDDINEFNSKINQYIKFFNSLIYLLPCSRCRHHYKITLAKSSAKNNCESKEKAIKWMIDFHNDVNTRLNKFGITKKRYSRLDADNLYLVDGKLKINHQKLAVFVNIILNTANDIKNGKIFLQTLSDVFPCNKCKIIIDQEISSKIINNITKSHDFVSISERLISKINNGHILYSELVKNIDIFGKNFILDIVGDLLVWDCKINKNNILYYRIYNTKHKWIYFVRYSNNKPKDILFTCDLHSLLNPPTDQNLWVKYIDNI